MGRSTGSRGPTEEEKKAKAADAIVQNFIDKRAGIDAGLAVSQESQTVAQARPATVAAAATPAREKLAFNQDVKDIQAYMRLLGLDEPVVNGQKKQMLVDGLPGNITKTGIAKFKADNKLPDNASMADIKTAMENKIKGDPKATSLALSKIMSDGAKANSHDVMAMQTTLNLLAVGKPELNGIHSAVTGTSSPETQKLFAALGIAGNVPGAPQASTAFTGAAAPVQAATPAAPAAPQAVAQASTATPPRFDTTLPNRYASSRTVGADGQVYDSSRGYETPRPPLRQAVSYGRDNYGFATPSYAGGYPPVRDQFYRASLPGAGAAYGYGNDMARERQVAAIDRQMAALEGQRARAMGGNDDRYYDRSREARDMTRADRVSRDRMFSVGEMAAGAVLASGAVGGGKGRQAAQILGAGLILDGALSAGGIKERPVTAQIFDRFLRP